MSLSCRPLASCPMVDVRLLGGLVLCGPAQATPGVFPNLVFVPWSSDSAVNVRADGLDPASVLCSKRKAAAWICYLTPAQLATCEVTLGSGGFGDRRHNSVIINLLHSWNQLRLGTHHAVALLGLLLVFMLWQKCN